MKKASKGMVLIVDDEFDIMNFYVEALSESGFEVVFSKSPNQLFTYLKNKNYPELIAIILDIMMPDSGLFNVKETNDWMDTGYQTYLMIRNNPKYATTPIIILTNTSLQESLDNFKEEPFMFKLQKVNCPPHDLVQIVNNLRNFLRNG